MITFTFGINLSTRPNMKKLSKKLFIDKTHAY